MKITHWGISYFRSIGEKPVMLDLTKKINVLVGANNSGKSNALSGLQHTRGKLRGSEYAAADFHQLNSGEEPTVRLSGTIETEYGADLPLWFVGVLRGHLFNVTSGFWNDWDINKTERFLNSIKKQTSGYHLTGSELEEFKNLQGTEIASRAFQNLPQVLLIPQFRKIDPTAEKYDLDGKGIVARLASWDRPNFGKRSDRNKLIQIRDLLRHLIQSPDAEIEVSGERAEILVTVRDLQLPLENYGTGVHQVIILAIAVLSVENSIVCIEEPEIHLHPLLQRRFVEFLHDDKTGNNYIITTHSPALIALAEDVAVTHLWLDEKGVTQSRPIATSADSLRALHDLGAQASDLLQANSVIWVEGPSDRTYLNRWLELLHPGKFREGIDYSVMFYGGRLLSHLSMERDEAVETPEDEAAELIQLLRINQHSAILIDSDRTKAGAELNKTKQRIEAECTKSDVFCWITPGREIENTLPETAINAVYGELSKQPVTVKLKPYQKIEDALKSALKPTWPREHYYDHAKAQFAHKISEHLAADNLSPEVHALVNQLVKVIRHQPL